jgi:hypothetical protein
VHVQSGTARMHYLHRLYLGLRFMLLSTGPSQVPVWVVILPRVLSPKGGDMMRNNQAPRSDS